MSKNIPEISLERLPVYLNYLRSLPEEGNKYISSGAIAIALGMGEVLVRKDLAYTSAVGKPKVGYLVKELISALENFLRCDEFKNAVIVGVGGLGKAILAYGGFKNYGINVVAAFDCDKDKIGTQIEGKPILSDEEMEKGIREHGATLAVIAVPASAAQGVADKLIAVGISSILSFAPIHLNVPANVTVKNIDVAGSLAVLSALSK